MSRTREILEALPHNVSQGTLEAHRILSMFEQLAAHAIDLEGRLAEAEAEQPADAPMRDKQGR